MNEIFESFRRHYESEGKTDKTVSDYIFNIKLFLTYLEEKNQLEINDIDSLELVIDEDIREYIIHCQKVLDNKERTINLKLTSLRRFYSFLNNKRILNSNPTQNIKDLPLPEDYEADFLNVDEAFQLISTVENSTKTNCNKFRDTLILKIFLYCGLRISEVNKLKVSDVKDKDVLKITGKRKATRHPALNSEIIKSFNEYMKYRENNNMNDEILFLTSKGKPMSKGAIFNVVKKYAALSGIKKDIHPHSLRHAYASITAKTVNVLELKRLMGHKKLSTTDIYYHMDTERAVEIANNNPLLKKAQES